jgi:hypothetical protein
MLPHGLTQDERKSKNFHKEILSKENNIYKETVLIRNSPTFDSAIEERAMNPAKPKRYLRLVPTLDWFASKKRQGFIVRNKKGRR